PTASLRFGLEFDAPFTRLLERNAYRESLIDYQRSRRDFIQSRDALHLGLRALIRQVEQLRQNLEIQRNAVAIAMRRVDLTQLQLNEPPPPPTPGQRPRKSDTTAINLLAAQSALQTTQNNFLAAWLNHRAARMRLDRELGVMMLDPEGQWIPYSLQDSDSAVPIDEKHEEGPEDPAPLPPEIPPPVINAAERLEARERSQENVPATALLPHGSIKGTGWSR
ncbi:MAG: TolC family protein, partial [Planctomycetales bacterium]